MKNLFRKMLKELFRDVDDMYSKIHWVVEDEEGEEYYAKVEIFTRTNRYHILCDVSRDGPPGGYLACMVSGRKPLAGEEHYRGNDLSDGPFSLDTWNQIKNDIISYELVKIVKSARRKKRKNEIL
jgi:hypothetical protein